MTPTELLSNPWVAAVVGGVSLTSVKYVADVFISSLPAPQAHSSPSYRYWFTVANRFAANWARANSTAVESSPNFAAAVNIQNAKEGTEKVVVDMAPEPKP
jgi:hypothetical protein